MNAQRLNTSTESIIAYHDWNEKGYVAPYDFVVMLAFPAPPTGAGSMGAWDSYNREVQEIQRYADANNIILHGCDICGASLKNNFVCSDATGKKFVVGCDCVEKLDDVDLVNKVQLEAYKHEKKLRQERKARNAALKAAETARLNKIRYAENEAAWVAANPELVEAYTFCMTNAAAWVGAKDIAEKVRVWGSISEKQVAVLVRQLEEFNAEKNRPEPTDCPTGKVEITGEIIATKWVENHFSYGGGTLKMIVLDDRGFKVFGTLPAKLPNARKGSRVQFVATVEAKSGEPTFGYFSRPTKAVQLDEVAEPVEGELAGAGRR